MVHLRSGKLLVQTIGRDGRLMIRVGRCDSELPFATGSNSFISHEFGDGVFGVFDAVLLEFTVHSWASVVSHPWLLVNLFDRFNGFVSFDRGGRWLCLLPLVVSSPADLQHAALNLNGPSFSMLEDEVEPQLFSLAKKAVAFFRISRSILS